MSQGFSHYSRNSRISPAKSAKIIVIALWLTGCAIQPKAWIRADGSAVDPGQFRVAQTVCDGEVHKADLAGNNDEIELLRANSRAKIMAGCMAAHGYLEYSR